MKKNILIFCAALTTFSLMAFSYANWNNSATNQKEISCSKTAVWDHDFLNVLNIEPDFELFYNVDDRYLATITKEDLHKAKSIIDIFPKKATKSVESYQNARVSILHDDNEITEIGNSEILNTAQIKLLQSTDYSNNIRVTSICERKNGNTFFKTDSLVYWMTIVPEKEAEYADGHDALIKYLKENSKENTVIIKKDELQPGRVNFTVTKEGTIANVKLNSTSGYPSVDEALIKLVRNMPENWNPATNSKGEKVNQELVFFFGLAGC